MNNNEEYPYGRCECPEHPNCQGPAFYEVKRDGKTIKVCTRCDLPSDTDKKFLIKEDQVIGPFWRYDKLGVMKAAIDQIEQENYETTK